MPRFNSDFRQSRLPHPSSWHARRNRAGFKSLLMVLTFSFAIIIAGVIIFFQFGDAIPDDEVITYQVQRSDLIVSVLEQGTLESSDNTEIKCKVRGQNTITWVVESGTFVEKGDEIVRLDTLALEEAITERTKFALLTKASEERLKASVESAELAIKEYKEGTLVAELRQLEKDLVVAQSNLKAARNLLQFNERLAQRGFANQTTLNELKISEQQYEQEVEKLGDDIKLLRNYTSQKEIASLEGEFEAVKADYAAESERAKADEKRRIDAVKELEFCVVRAPRSGLVIHPSAAQWRGAPDIEEGATVHKTQVMLLMPNLDKMQIKVGIHESVVDRVKPGMRAIVTLNDRTLDSEVQSVASITRPAGWWTGNVVKYDTIIKLPEKEPGLKPGMSAEVMIILASHENVVTVPVAAILQTEKGNFCWVKKNNQIKRRLIEVGDSNDVFIQVISGLEAGDDVVLDPLSYIDEAEAEALLPKKSEEELVEPPEGSGTASE